MDLPQQLNLHQRLLSDHGGMAENTFREWEKVERAIARYSNHLHFTLHCKHHNVFPVSLKIKSSMRGKEAKRIITNTQKALTSLRIKEIIYKRDVLKNKSAAINEKLFGLLPCDVFTEVQMWVRHAHKAELDTLPRPTKTKVCTIDFPQKQPDRSQGGADPGCSTRGDQSCKIQVGD